MTTRKVNSFGDVKAFGSYTKRPVVVESDVGEEVYKWSYLDKDGKMQQGETNFQEKIQSFKKHVDYKSRVKAGEQFSEGNGMYLDVSGIGEGFIGLRDYLEQVGIAVQNDMEALKAKQVTVQGEQVAEQKVEQKSEEKVNE